MTITQLKYFLAICENLNITKTAKELNISQPSLTVSIKNLENELGVKLFIREKKHILLTEEGEFFLNKIIPLLKDYEDLRSEMITIGVKHNKLRIGIPPMIGSFMYPLIFSDFIEHHPDIKLEIVERGALKLQEMLLDEKLDLTFLIGESRLNTDIIFTSITKKALKLYVSLDHPLSKHDSLSIDEIKETNLIMFNSEFYTRKIVLDAYSKKGLVPNIILETSQISTVTRFISSKLSASFLLENCIPEISQFKTIHVPDLSSVSIGLGQKKNRFVSDSMKIMINFIKAQDL